MSSDNLPTIRQEQPVVLHKESDYEIVESRNTTLTRSPMSSIAGQVVKLAVYAVLDWFNNRRTSERNFVERGNEVQPDMRDNAQQLSEGGKSRLQRGKSDGRGIRRRKRRWRQS